MNNQPKFKKGDIPVVDTLAIPDDHVWPVEWRKIEDDECYENIIAVNRETNDTWHTTDMGYVLTSSGYTHYLTEADLLKLPFQK